MYILAIKISQFNWVWYGVDRVAWYEGDYKQNHQELVNDDDAELDVDDDHCL